MTSADKQKILQAADNAQLIVDAMGRQIDSMRSQGLSGVVLDTLSHARGGVQQHVLALKKIVWGGDYPPAVNGYKPGSLVESIKGTLIAQGRAVAEVARKGGA